MSDTTAKQSIDMRGKRITTYILHDAVMKLRDMAEGEILGILADSFEAIESDIRAWCQMTGHVLLELETEANHQTYYVKKAVPRDSEHELALVLSNPGLEELLSPLGFALGAALSGTRVHIYFQGPAVRVLAKGFREKLHGIGRPFSAFARKGLAKVGHVPPQEKLRQLRELGAQFYVCGPSMEHFGVKKDDLIFDDLLIAEYLTFMEVMNRADVQFFL
jgi:predicted peroxiredoxin/TusA-related sulfurtransferase